MAATKSQELHVKFFDVVWANDQAEPRARLQIQADSLPFSVVPVVFITNEVMSRIREEDISQLASDIVTEVLNIWDFKVAKNALLGALPQKTLQQPYEWQIDCDWTANTRERYFTFLRALRRELSAGSILSATVRLHQFRDQSTQGIPPIDKGLLMAYNVGELDQWTTENSQLDTNITANYLKPNVTYPLPLDVALPYFEWGVVFREGKLALLINGIQPSDLIVSPIFLGKSHWATLFELDHLYKGNSLESRWIFLLENG
ncbi:MAG: hypothetical protein AAFQ37_02905 [Bacteroidota bacterium]